MHPLLQFLASMPQFQAHYMSNSVVHMTTGCVITKYQSDEPKHRATINAYWPGQNREELCLFDAWKYIKLQLKEAAALGEDPELLKNSLAQLTSTFSE